jgi:glutamate-1-semialdehyde 2,1-aminomutase
VRVVAIVQARMGSTRLPKKVMKQIIGAPMIELLLARLAMAREIDQIVLATSKDPQNRPLVKHVTDLGFSCEQGSENDVLERYVLTGEKYNADVIVRITGDCPLVDPELVDQCILRFHKSKVDYLSNIHTPTYPDGLDVEIVRFPVLQRAFRESDNPYDHEHVTPYVRESGLFSIENYQHDEDLSALRWAVDDPEDFEVISNVFQYFAPEKHFSWLDVLALQQERPKLFSANETTKRNLGAIMGTGQKLWQRAKHVIPGGNMLLSKRAEMFLPDQWPTYFSKAKGCRVWDLNGREYIDMSIMGVGTNILGYGHPEVDEAVQNAVQQGNMSSLNCAEEVYLAERLIELHPWADMVRFARSGGEANAVAIRIARAATGRDKVAICGYHGWHDWYLSANLGHDKKLDGHLLPGLEVNGVPRCLMETALPFNYNRLDELEALVQNHKIGVIKMEVSRNEGPAPDFLENVRELATQNNIVLIFDECTSGFRETYGGLHKKYGVEPDMAIFGKALGNGYAITATIGRREVMEAAQSTFISSTFWTERIGPTAALKTLEVMERERSWEQITQTGLEIRQHWKSLAEKHGLKLSHWGLPALAGFTFESSNALAYKTLITQEMLYNGFLVSNSIYVCTEHTQNLLEDYFLALEPIFQTIQECEDGRDVYSLLKGPVCHSGFKRLN